MPTTTPTLTNMADAVFAATSDGRYVRVSAPQISYAECVERFNELEAARRDGRTPHVKFYAVRNLADPQWRDAPLSKVHGRALVGRGFADDKEFPGRQSNPQPGINKAARAAAKRFLGETPYGTSQGSGGWYYENDRPLAQGAHSLSNILYGRGWIFQHDGRWFVTEPIETKTVVS